MTTSLARFRIARRAFGTVERSEGGRSDRRQRETTSAVQTLKHGSKTGRQRQSTTSRRTRGESGRDEGNGRGSGRFRTRAKKRAVDSDPRRDMRRGRVKQWGRKVEVTRNVASNASGRDGRERRTRHAGTTDYGAGHWIRAYNSSRRASRLRRHRHGMDVNAIPRDHLLALESSDDSQNDEEDLRRVVLVFTGPGDVARRFNALISEFATHDAVAKEAGVHFRCYRADESHDLFRAVGIECVPTVLFGTVSSRRNETKRSFEMVTQPSSRRLQHALESLGVEFSESLVPMVRAVVPVEEDSGVISSLDDDNDVGVYDDGNDDDEDNDAFGWMKTSNLRPDEYADLRRVFQNVDAMASDDFMTQVVGRSSDEMKRVTPTGVNEDLDTHGPPVGMTKDPSVEETVPSVTSDDDEVSFPMSDDMMELISILRRDSSKTNNDKDGARE